MVPISMSFTVSLKKVLISERGVARNTSASTTTPYSPICSVSFSAVLRTMGENFSKEERLALPFWKSEASWFKSLRRP